MSLQEEDMPAEVNIDELLDLRTDEERTERLQVNMLFHMSLRPSTWCLMCLFLFVQDIFHSCNKESKVSL